MGARCAGVERVVYPSWGLPGQQGAAGRRPFWARNDSTCRVWPSECVGERMFKHWRKVLTLGYPLAALCWTLPAGYFPFKETLDPVIAKPFVFLNLWQAWDMFGPQPLREDLWVEVTIVDRAGQKRQQAVSHMPAMPYLERYQRERWRKFFNEHLRLDAKSFLWAPYVEYVRREEARRGVTAETIELSRWWRPSVVPVAPELRADQRSEAWGHFTFHTWKEGGGAAQAVASPVTAP